MKPNDETPESKGEVTYRARWIVPIVGPPLQGGWIRLRDGTVRGLGRGRGPTAAIDLGDHAVLPGLVNAHTHLEFSDLRRPIAAGGDGRSLAPLESWIGRVIATRAAATATDKSAAVGAGIRESIDAGVRLLAEIMTPSTDRGIESVDPKIDIVTLSEVIGLSADRYSERFAAARAIAARDETAGYSPHAPYSTHRDVITDVVRRARADGRTVAMHVAESPAERQLIREGTGGFADALKAIGVWQDGLFPWSTVSPTGEDFFDLIDTLAEAPRALLIHGNDFTSREIQRIARYPELTVVYCPRTHDFFRYQRHPIAECVAAGVRVALGTDSRASNPDLNLWNEVRFLLDKRQDVAPEMVLATATLHGADALGRPEAGRLAIGCRPGLGTVATGATDEDGLYADLATTPYRSLSDRAG